ncbi:MAG: AMIN domain-containing protein, partial [Gammaproteobacteria bacterium]|nr:AMIN domain-containing protein [Gammaproteobacteria bacterium]
MRLLLCLLLVGQTALLWAAPTQIKNVRIWAAPDSTRVVFDVSGPVQYQLTKLTDPYRIVIDIKDTVATSSFGQPSANDKFLQRLRGAR